MKCYECEYLRVVSVPDWFCCKKDNREAPRQSSLNDECPLLKWPDGKEFDYTP